MWNQMWFLITIKFVSNSLRNRIFVFLKCIYSSQYQFSALESLFCALSSSLWFVYFYFFAGMEIMLLGSSLAEVQIPSCLTEVPLRLSRLGLFIWRQSSVYQVVVTNLKGTESVSLCWHKLPSPLDGWDGPESCGNHCCSHTTVTPYWAEENPTIPKFWF